MELGRIRLGEKGPKGQPIKLDTFRLTSASRQLLEAAAELYGGTVTEWQGAPDEGYFQVTTDATELDILLPPVLSMGDGEPTLPYSQWFELWSGAGIQRRCDGMVEALTGKPCVCGDQRGTGPDYCAVKTRVSVMLPNIAGIGVWRLETSGWNAAQTLPGTLELLRQAAEGAQFIPAVLRIEKRTSKKPGEPTRKFTVPVIDLPGTTAGQLLEAANMTGINPPAHMTGKPELPRGAEPVAERFDNDTSPGFPDPPEIDPPGLALEDEETIRLQSELLDLSRELGVGTAANNAIRENLEKNDGDVEKHKTWLRSQITRARNKQDAP